MWIKNGWFSSTHTCVLPVCSEFSQNLHREIVWQSFQARWRNYRKSPSCSQGELRRRLQKCVSHRNKPRRSRCLHRWTNKQRRQHSSKCAAWLWYTRLLHGQDKSYGAFLLTHIHFLDADRDFSEQNMTSSVCLQCSISNDNSTFPIAALVGPYGSRNSLQVAGLLQVVNIPAISPSATSEELSW